MRKIRISLLALLLVLVLVDLCQAQPYVPDPDVYGKIKGAYQPIGLVAARLDPAEARGGDRQGFR